MCITSIDIHYGYDPLSHVAFQWLIVCRRNKHTMYLQCGEPFYNEEDTLVDVDSTHLFRNILDTEPIWMEAVLIACARHADARHVHVTHTFDKGSDPASGFTSIVNHLRVLDCVMSWDEARRLYRERVVELQTTEHSE